MSITKANLLEFLRLHHYGVEASHAIEGPPQAALVSFVVNDRLELFFDSFDSTRKVANLRRDPRIAFVIGGYIPGDQRTVQYEGGVDVPGGAELERFKSDYFALHPDGLRRSGLPGITYFRVRARWIRYTDFNAAPARVVVFEGAALNPTDRAEHHAAATPYTHMREPWKPKITREPVFNAFANPLARIGKLENPPLPQTEISGKT
jgi:general stress protein 26